MDVHVAVGVYQFVSAQIQYMKGKVNDRKLPPQLKSRKEDAIETQEKWKDGKVVRPQQHGSEAVEVSDTVEEEGLSPIATTSFPCSVVKELCGLLHNDLARMMLRSHVYPNTSSYTQVLTALHCYSTDSLWVKEPGC